MKRTINLKNILLIALSLLLIFPLIKGLNVKAAGYEYQNGTYTAEYEVGGTSGIGKNMIKKYFDPSCMIEKIDDYYFISLSQSSKSITGLTLLVEDKNAGWMVRSEEGENKTTTFTVSSETIHSEMRLKCYITKMGMYQEFTITIKEETIKLDSDLVEKIPNRPGYFGETPEFEKVFPMWGYIAILGGVLALGAIITTTIVLVRKRKRKSE